MNTPTQVAEALAAAHGAGVVHRDVKPANILILPNGIPKVTDFGVARAIGDQTALTRTGATVGSPAYMAPEQVRGEPVDARADIFSLGVMAYQMLLGRRPFPADTITEIFACRRGAEFHVDPEETMVTINGEDIGIADDWDGGGGGKTYFFPGQGRYLVKLSCPGRETAWIRITATDYAEEEVVDVDTEIGKDR